MKFLIRLSGIVFFLIVSGMSYADSFDTTLPTVSNLTPQTIADSKWAVSTGVVKEVDDFRLQYDPVAGENQHLSNYAGYNRKLVLNIRKL